MLIGFFLDFDHSAKDDLQQELITIA